LVTAERVSMPLNAVVALTWPWYWFSSFYLLDLYTTFCWDCVIS
jgi:hypothetical protein